MDAAIARLRDRGLLDGDSLTDEGHRVRRGIEAATDLAQQPVVDALAEGLDRTVDALGSWSEAVVARGWFPPDPSKRAAG
jgi:Helix-turn-helix family